MLLLGTRIKGDVLSSVPRTLQAPENTGGMATLMNLGSGPEVCLMKRYLNSITGAMA